VRFFCTGFAHDLASMERLDLTGRDRRVLLRRHLVCGTGLRLRPRGVQRQQERGACWSDTPPRMPVPVAMSLVPWGLPPPTLQLPVVLEACQRVSPDAEAYGPARPHPRPMVVQGCGPTGALLWPGRAWGLSRRGRTVRTGQRGRAALALVPWLTDAVGCCLPLGHAPGDPSGQALALGGCAAATVRSPVAWERRPDVSPGCHQASAGRV